MLYNKYPYFYNGTPCVDFSIAVLYVVYCDNTTVYNPDTNSYESTSVRYIDKNEYNIWFTYMETTALLTEEPKVKLHTKKNQYMITQNNPKLLIYNFIR